MRTDIGRIAIAAGAWLVVLAGAGCASPGQMARGLIEVPFRVASHVAVETTKVPIEAAEMGAKGIVSAVLK